MSQIRILLGMKESQNKEKAKKNPEQKKESKEESMTDVAEGTATFLGFNDLSKIEIIDNYKPSPELEPSKQPEVFSVEKQIDKPRL